MEIFIDIKGYEGLYQISNKGRVKSFKSYGHNKIGMLSERINTKGYPHVVLYSNGNKSTYSVHRLVANAFIPNLHNKPQVNHINGIKTDNRVENLEWCTASENSTHAFINGLRKIPKGKYHYASKAVMAYLLTGELVGEWASATEASKALNIGRSGIKECLRGRSNTSGGYKWEYLNYKG